MELMNKIAIGMMVRMMILKQDVKDFLDNQDGISAVVATIIILLITVILVGIFWDRLKTWVSGMMNQIFGSSFDEGGL